MTVLLQVSVVDGSSALLSIWGFISPFSCLYCVLCDPLPSLPVNHLGHVCDCWWPNLIHQYLFSTFIPLLMCCFVLNLGKVGNLAAVILGSGMNITLSLTYNRLYMSYKPRTLKKKKKLNRLYYFIRQCFYEEGSRKYVLILILVCI